MKKKYSLFFGFFFASLLSFRLWSRTFLATLYLVLHFKRLDCFPANNNWLIGNDDLQNAKTSLTFDRIYLLFFGNAIVYYSWLEIEKWKILIARPTRTVTDLWITCQRATQQLHSYIGTEKLFKYGRPTITMVVHLTSKMIILENGCDSVRRDPKWILGGAIYTPTIPADHDCFYDRAAGRQSAVWM